MAHIHDTAFSPQAPGLICVTKVCHRLCHKSGTTILQEPMGKMLYHKYVPNEAWSLSQEQLEMAKMLPFILHFSHVFCAPLCMMHRRISQNVVLVTALLTH